VVVYTAGLPKAGVPAARHAPIDHETGIDGATVPGGGTAADEGRPVVVDRLLAVGGRVVDGPDDGAVVVAGAAAVLVVVPTAIVLLWPPPEEQAAPVTITTATAQRCARR
jgi:hypothetical protein